jgi:signal peptidase
LEVETLKKLWKNEYFQTAITIALIIIAVFGFYFSAQAVLGTPYPALAVASGSMLPTLNIGDLIIVQKIDPAQINADPNGLTGDILVYKRGNELIVHRAVKIELRNDVYYITTRGDNSGIDDPAWPSTSLVGKVIARIPYVGNLPLFLHSERNMYIVFLIFLVILVILMLPFGSHGDETPKEEKQPIEEEKPPIKIDLNLVLYILLNAIIVGFMIFSLWGSFTFWQPGATPPQATIRGLFSDLQFHEEFSSNVYLFQGFLTYKIDWKVNNGIRLGVPTFSWFQFSIIVLAIFNAWKLFNYVKTRKSRIQAENV